MCRVRCTGRVTGVKLRMSRPPMVSSRMASGWRMAMETILSKPAARREGIFGAGEGGCGHDVDGLCGCSVRREMDSGSLPCVCFIHFRPLVLGAPPSSTGTLHATWSESWFADVPACIRVRCRGAFELVCVIFAKGAYYPDQFETRPESLSFSCPFPHPKALKTHQFTPN